MTVIQLIPQGFQQAANTLQQAPRIIRDATEAVIRPLARETEAHWKEQLVFNTGQGWGGKDTGNYQRSIHGEFKTSIHGDFEASVVAGWSGAIFVERGTRPHWPPIAALAGWARRHGRNAFLVARAISRYGTRAYRHAENTYNWLLPKAREEMEEIGRRIVVSLRWRG